MISAQDKVALLIGNEHYRTENTLPAAAIDLRTLSGILTRMHFKVVTLLDLYKEEALNAVNTFCELLDEGVYGKGSVDKTYFLFKPLRFILVR